MITAEWCRMMARYNAWQNDAHLRAAGTLPDAERRADRGAFFGSIEATLNHLLWGDLMWMHRLDGWDRPPGKGIADTLTLTQDFAELGARRRATDASILRWAESGPDPSGALTWYSGATGREVTRPRALCITHMFNHQTHHRGQVHAMMTAAGHRLPDTDLVFMPEAG